LLSGGAQRTAAVMYASTVVLYLIKRKTLPESDKFNLGAWEIPILVVARIRRKRLLLFQEQLPDARSAPEASGSGIAEAKAKLPRELWGCALLVRFTRPRWVRPGAVLTAYLVPDRETRTHDQCVFTN